MKRVFILTFFSAFLLTSAAAEKIMTVLLPSREVVLSAQVESVMRNINFAVGDMFPAGATLAELNPQQFLLESSRAKAKQKYTQEIAANTRKEFAGGFSSLEKLRTAEIEAQLAQNALDLAQLRLSYTRIKAPFSGKLQEVMVKEHEFIRPGQPICRIINDRKLHAVCYVPMQNKKFTTFGNTVKMKIDFHPAAVTGKILEVAPQADHNTGTVKVKIEIDNPDYALRAGMTGVLLP
jgi:membrane fusion protein (multidrug efflux system)